ncbi:hypothetical protein EMPS_06992 [Entomortierella parvispora]|uniref:Uncharacterized protein n=1 Tax=Entomortierella parvispora TaxID=205924 RepID=A0A9P3LXX4_9FUNG|nr:hypothetical protein EMPS_06992 [Entomortierella parvispora]
MSDSTSTSTLTSTSLSETITSTIIGTATSTASATITAITSIVAPTSTPTAQNPSTPEPTYNPEDPYSNPNLLCDWTRTASNCRDADFVKWMLVASSIAHFLVGLYGVWLLAYRNRGFNKKIVTELFIKVGTGLRPKPMDCIIFFTTIACFVKVAANLPLVFHALPHMMWLRVAIEQIYWIFVAFAFSSYFVGLLYAMPVTTREGIFAVYQPEVVFGAKPLPPIHVLTPNTVQKNILLALGLIYPTVFGAGLGVASGALYDNGYFYAGRVLMLLQYSNWVLILWSMAVMFFYYGLKYTFILRANIIIAEAALKAPRAAFGIGNLKSRSPARFLFIQLQITGFGGCAVTVLAGSLCMLWVLFKDQILAMEDDKLPHAMAVFWTCMIALAFFVVMSLIAAQSIRNRKRGLHEPSTTTMSHSLSPSGQKNGSKPTKSSPLGTGLNTSSDAEARLTQHSSGDLSTLQSGSEKASLERMDQFDDMRQYLPHPLHQDESLNTRAAAAASVAAMAELSERMDREAAKRESWRPSTPTSADRPLTIQTNNGVTTNANGHSQIRESVFGGRTAREDGSISPPPQHSGFSMPSFPLVAIRSSSRNSVQPRPSTSSATHTTSGSSSRLSHGSSKHGASSSGSHHLPPTSPTTSTNPVNLQQQTQLQLQLLQQQQQQQQGGPRSPVSQRVVVNPAGFQPIPESQQYFASDDYGGDLLYTDSLRLQQQYQQQQQQPQQQVHTRTKSNSSNGGRIQPSPVIAPMSPPLVYQQYPQHHQYYDQSRPISPPPRMSTSSSTRGYPIQQQQQEMNLPMDMQLQQQHPLHQVAFKGLSPPPRSTPTSSTSPSLMGHAIATSARSAPSSTTAASGSSFPAGYEDPYPQTNVPRVGGAVRRASGGQAKKETVKDSASVMSNSSISLAAPVPTSPIAASRGPGGGYQSQRTAESAQSFSSPSLMAATAAASSSPSPGAASISSAPSGSAKSLRQTQAFSQQQQQQQQQQQMQPRGGPVREDDSDEMDDGASIESAGDTWPLPPSFK